MNSALKGPVLVYKRFLRNRIYNPVVALVAGIIGGVGLALAVTWPWVGLVGGFVAGAVLAGYILQLSFMALVAEASADSSIKRLEKRCADLEAKIEARIAAVETKAEVNYKSLELALLSESSVTERL